MNAALNALQYDAPELEPVDAWSFDELERDSDLESLRWALERTDDARF